MESGAAVLEVECPEPEGKVVRRVEPVSLTAERLREYYDRLNEFPVLFNEHTGSLEDFIRTFVRPRSDGLGVDATGLIWEVDDVGILYLTRLRPGVSAYGDFTFWDQRLRGREPLVREALRHVFERFGFHRIETEVALYARPAMAFVERVGFKKEGRKREAVLYTPKDAEEPKWFDTNLYSILSHEVMEGEDNGTAV